MADTYLVDVLEPWKLEQLADGAFQATWPDGWTKRIEGFEAAVCSRRAGAHPWDPPAAAVRSLARAYRRAFLASRGELL